MLLEGVNDDLDTMKTLVQKLLMCRVRPYYLYQCDLINGSAHLRASVAKGIEIIEGLRGHTTGYGVPQFVIDAPGGGGKVPINPGYVLYHDNEKIVIRNYEGQDLRISRNRRDQNVQFAPAARVSRRVSVFVIRGRLLCHSERSRGISHCFSDRDVSRKASFDSRRDIISTLQDRDRARAGSKASERFTDNCTARGDFVLHFHRITGVPARRQ